MGLAAAAAALAAACAGPPATVTAGPELLVPLPAPSEPPPVLESFTVVATGDVLVHPALTDQALADSATGEPDFGPLLAGVAPVVSAADLALCHRRRSTSSSAITRTWRSRSR